MKELSASERAWIWLARLIGGSATIYTMAVLQWDAPLPAYALMGGLLGGEFVYKASRKA